MLYRKNSFSNFRWKTFVRSKVRSIKALKSHRKKNFWEANHWNVTYKSVWCWVVLSCLQVSKKQKNFRFFKINRNRIISLVQKNSFKRSSQINWQKLSCFYLLAWKLSLMCCLPIRLFIVNFLKLKRIGRVKRLCLRHKAILFKSVRFLNWKIHNKSQVSLKKKICSSHK